MATSKGGLGRGLSALLPTGGEAAGGVEEVDIDLIAPNPEQPRGRIEPEALAELAASIQTHGVLQPLVVTRQQQGGATTYHLIAGERRWQAARQAGLARVPVVVRETSPAGLLELALVENLQRADLSPLEEARAYRRLIDEFGLTQERVAERVGKSRAAIANVVRLLALPDAIREGLAAGTISEGHARALLGLPDDEGRLGLYAEVVRAGLNVRQTEELARRLREAPAEAAPPPTRAPRPADPDLIAIAERLQRSLGTRVALQRGAKGGKIVIQFYGDEDLEALLSRLLGDEEPA